MTRVGRMGLYPEWLLDVTVAGQVVRLATSSVTVSRRRGDAVRYQEGLRDPRAALASMGSGSASMTLRIDATEAYDRLVGLFDSLARGQAVVRRWLPGQTLEDAAVILEGAVRRYRYGERGESISVTVATMQAEVATLIPLPTMAVDATTWPVRSGWITDETVVGAYYPVVLGCPGADDGSAAASTAALVVETDGASTADRLLVAGHRVAATSVEVFDYTDDAAPEQATLSVVETVDLLDRRVSVVEVGTAFTAAVAPGRVYYVGWPADGGGLLDPVTGAAMRGLGDVLRWLIDRCTGRRFDRDRAAASMPRLNRYLVDTHLNVPTNPQDLITALLQDLPVEQRLGPDGVWFFVRPVAAQAEAVAWRLSVDHGEVQRSSDLEVDATAIANEITVEYGPDRDTGRLLHRVVITGDTAAEYDPFQAVPTGTDDRVVGTYRARVSMHDHGRRPLLLQLWHTWDRATAVQVGRDILEERALPRRFVDLEGGPEIEEIAPGSVGELTDTAMGLTAARCLVLDTTVGGAEVRLSLEILDDPAQRV